METIESDSDLEVPTSQKTKKTMPSLRNISSSSTPSASSLESSSEEISSSESSDSSNESSDEEGAFEDEVRTSKQRINVRSRASDIMIMLNKIICFFFLFFVARHR